MGKRNRLKKFIRVQHKYLGRVASVVLPVAGALVGGPAGAAAGGALGTAASYYGEKQGALASGKKGRAVKKAGRRGLKRGAIIGGGVTLGAGAIALLGGTGLTTGILGASSSSLGGAAKKLGPQKGGSSAGQAADDFSTESSNVTGAAAKTGSDNLLKNLVTAGELAAPSILGGGKDKARQESEAKSKSMTLILIAAAAFFLLSGRQSK